MRSKRRADPGQLPLWDESAEPRARARRKRRPVDLLEYEVVDDAFASRGWHTGAMLFYEPARHRERGQVIVVRRGDQIRVGEYDVVWGRPVLRTDRGTTWISPEWAIDGVVRMVEPPLIDFTAARTVEA